MKKNIGNRINIPILPKKNNLTKNIARSFPMVDGANVKHITKIVIKPITIYIKILRLSLLFNFQSQSLKGCEKKSYLVLSIIGLTTLLKYSFNISKLKKQSNFFGNFFSKLIFKFCGFWGLPTWRCCYPPYPIYRREMTCIESNFNVSLRVETTRAMSQALLRFCIYIRNYGGSGVSNPLTALVGCNTPHAFKS